MLTIWKNVISLSTAIRAAFFAYTYYWFIEFFYLKQSNALKECAFSELKTMDSSKNGNGYTRILEVGTGPGIHLK